MKKNWIWYGGFFILLLAGFYMVIGRTADFSRSGLPVMNDVKPFSFIDQNGTVISDRNVEGKVYVTEFFYTTCKGLCPRINANMRRVYDAFRQDSGFMIISHTSMPETDSVPMLKRYEYKMLTGTLVKNADGIYSIEDAQSGSGDALLPQNFKTNWFFVTGDKAALYSMARHSYLLDSQQDTGRIGDQFIHTQLFALVDKQRRVRGIYDGLKEEEVQKLLKDIPGLLKEKVSPNAVNNGWSNTPN